MLVAGTDDDEALERMLDLAEDLFETSPGWRSLRAVSPLMDVTRKADWLPPAQHRLYARFLAAANQTRVRELEAVHKLT